MLLRVAKFQCLLNAFKPGRFPLCVAFEEWAVEEGWAQLVLPSKEEAAEYFARFRAPSNLNPDSTLVDEEIVQGMVDELHMVMKSVRFSAATIVSPCHLSSPVISTLAAVYNFRLSFFAEESCISVGNAK